MKRRFFRQTALVLTLCLVALSGPIQAFGATTSVPNVDVCLAVDSTDLDVSNFVYDLQSEMERAYGFPAANLNITRAGTTDISTTNTFDWNIYDHYYASDYPTNGATPVNWAVYNGSQPYFYYEEESPEDSTSYFTGISSSALEACFNRSKHIYTVNNDIYFLGYSVPAFKDFMLYPDSNTGDKTIRFKIDQGLVDTHTVEGAGFLFNTSLTGGKINGYLVYNHYKDTNSDEKPDETMVELYKLTNVDAVAFHNEVSEDIFSGTIQGIELLTQKAASNNKIKEIRVRVTKDSLRYFEDNIPVIDTTGADQNITISDTGDGGFGPLVGYSSHYCDSLSYFTFKDLAMESSKPIGFSDAVAKNQWTNSRRFIVNVTDNGVPEFGSSTTMNSILSNLSANNVHYLGWGRNNPLPGSTFNTVAETVYGFTYRTVSQTVYQEVYETVIDEVYDTVYQQAYDPPRFMENVIDIQIPIPTESTVYRTVYSGYNKSQALAFIAQNGGRGMFIDRDDPNFDTYAEGIAAIAKYIYDNLADPTPTTPTTPAPKKHRHRSPDIPIVVQPLFTDIAGHWAQAQIENLAGRKIVQGYPDKSYRPNSQVTRAEFTSMLNAALELTSYKPTATETVYFTDISQTDWHYKAIATLAPDGIVLGYGDGTFRPNQLITREEATAMTARLLEKLKVSLNDSTVNFSDLNQVSDWAIKPLNKMVNAEIIKGLPDGNFRPAAYTTRAEATAIILRMLVKAKIL